MKISENISKNEESDPFSRIFFKKYQVENVGVIEFSICPLSCESSSSEKLEECRHCETANDEESNFSWNSRQFRPFLRTICFRVWQGDYNINSSSTVSLRQAYLIIRSDFLVICKKWRGKQEGNKWMGRFQIGRTSQISINLMTLTHHWEYWWIMWWCVEILASRWIFIIELLETRWIRILCWLNKGYLSQKLIILQIALIKYLFTRRKLENSMVLD